MIVGKHIGNSAALVELQKAGGIMAWRAWRTSTGTVRTGRDVPFGACLHDLHDGPIPPARISRWFIDHPGEPACIALVRC